MSSIKTNAIRAAFAFTAIALSATAAQAAPFYNNAVYGAVASDTSAEKHIDLAQGKHSFNVTDGDTVEFTKDGKSFTWHFSTLASAPVVKLSAIAPRDFKVDGVKIYVSPNPAYAGA